jgi:polar amino acid transport system permease protein
MDGVLGNVFDAALWATYGPRMLAGLWVTLVLVAISYSLGMVLGLLLAFARLSRWRILRCVSATYCWLMRGSPLLAQLFLLYYGLGSLREFWQDWGLWWFFRDAWYCALLAFSLNTAAYQAEIFRGSFLAIPAGQQEAAMALGLSRWARWCKVTLPQSLMVAIGPLGNELILLIKASALASLVTVYDVMGIAKLAFSRSFDFQVYLWAAVLYLLIVETLRRLLRVVERRLNRHLDSPG